MPEPITRDQFVATYGRTPAVGLGRLRSGCIVLQCSCTDPHCRGWAMASTGDLDGGFFRPTAEELHVAILHRSNYLHTATQDPTALAVDGPILNPECIVGKHGSCHEDAWDNVKDEPANCQCPCHEGNR